MVNEAAPLPPLSAQAQQTAALMREEADSYHQPLVGTEHLLLALLRTEGSAAARILASFDVTPPRAHEAVELLSGHGSRRHSDAGSTPNLTQRTAVIFTLADRLRRAFGHAAVTPEHLLLALLDVSGNAALGVLQTLGVDRGQLRDVTLAVLGGQTAAPPTTDAALPTADAPQLTHLDEHGAARMVDVGTKAETAREAIARGLVLMEPRTLQLIVAGDIAKGDVLATARIAGIMAAKQTGTLIPLCHPLLLTHVGVTLTPDEQQQAIRIEATVRTIGKTGVEMEALTAVSVAALTIYDMCKAVDRTMRISEIRLAEKRGGRSGELVFE